MPLDYNDARRVFSEKLAVSPEGYGRFEAAFQAMCEFVYQQGLKDGIQAARDADNRPEVFSQA